jgi:hypothetical protein
MGTTCKELVHELIRKGPHTTRELLDIATNFASGEEAVGQSSMTPRARTRGMRMSTRAAPVATL